MGLQNCIDKIPEATQLLGILRKDWRNIRYRNDIMIEETQWRIQGNSMNKWITSKIGKGQEC